MRTLQRGNPKKLKLLTQVFSCFNYFSIVSRGGIFLSRPSVFVPVKLNFAASVGETNESFDSSPTK